VPRAKPYRSLHPGYVTMRAFSDRSIRRFVAVSLSVVLVCTHAALAQHSSPPANAPIGKAANPKRIAPDPLRGLLAEHGWVAPKGLSHAGAMMAKIEDPG